MPSLRRQRVDVLVYILWSLVLSDLMQDHLCTVAKFKLRRMNKAERARLAGVNELNGKIMFPTVYSMRIVLHVTCFLYES